MIHGECNVGCVKANGWYVENLARIVDAAVELPTLNALHEHIEALRRLVPVEKVHRRRVD